MIEQKVRELSPEEKNILGKFAFWSKYKKEEKTREGYSCDPCGTGGCGSFCSGGSCTTCHSSPEYLDKKFEGDKKYN